MSDEAANKDVPPDRLSIVPTSKYYDEEKLKRGVGIKFKGVERTNVQEYCISEGWVTMVAGKRVDRYGRPLTIKSHGTVEAWYEDPEPDESADEAAEEAAE